MHTVQRRGGDAIEREKFQDKAVKDAPSLGDEPSGSWAFWPEARAECRRDHGIMNSPMACTPPAPLPGERKQLPVPRLATRRSLGTRDPRFPFDYR